MGATRWERDLRLNADGDGGGRHQTPAHGIDHSRGKRQARAGFGPFPPQGQPLAHGKVSLVVAISQSGVSEQLRRADEPRRRPRRQHHRAGRRRRRFVPQRAVTEPRQQDVQRRGDVRAAGHAAHHRTARPRDAAEAAAHGQQRQTARGDLRLHGPSSVAPNATQRRPDEGQASDVSSIEQRCEMTGMQAFRGRQRQLALPQQLIGADDLANLLPRRRHQLFLVLLHDTRSQPGRDPPGRIHIQFAQPPRRDALGRDFSARRVPAGVERRGHGLRLVQQRNDVRREILRSTACRHGVWHQRTVELGGLAGHLDHAEAGRRQVDRPNTDARQGASPL